MKPENNEKVLEKLLGDKTPSENYIPSLQINDDVFECQKSLMVKNPYTDKVQPGIISGIAFLGKSRELKNAYLIVEVDWEDTDPRLATKPVKRAFVDHVVVNIRTFYSYCKRKNIEFWTK